MTEAKVEDWAFPQLEAGAVLAGRYRILSRVGTGGMGLVFAAEEEGLGLKRLVAVKMLPPQMMLDQALMARFREEIKIVSALDHPNVIPIYSLGEHRGVYFYVMKLLDGQTAHQRLRQHGAFPEAELRRIVAPIARALHYAHGKGVIHRDVKSNNIHISIDGHPVLMDFGIARSSDSADITVPGQVVGTAEYMSPEQWYGEVDARSDIYSLGVVLFELAAGKLPFRSKHTFELMKMHQETPPPAPRTLAPTISLELEQIILRCLAKDPEARYQSAQALAEALESPFAPPPETAPLVEPETSAPPEAKTPVPTSATTAQTMVQTSPVAELSDQDKKAWDLCVAADRAYAQGELRRALRLMHRAAKKAPDSAQVRNRRVKFERMDELTRQILARADRAFAEGRLKQAMDDYENVLRCLPLTRAAEQMGEVRERIERAEGLARRAHEWRAAGQAAKAARFLQQAYRLNQDLNLAAISAAKTKRTAAKPAKRRRRIAVNRGVLQLILFLLLLAGVVLTIRPAIRYWADREYARNDEQSLFLSPMSAYRSYNVLKVLLSPDPRIDERLREISRRAKSYYIGLATTAMKNDDLGNAIVHFRAALYYDPTDPKLRDLLGVLETKHQVQKSLGKQP